MPTFLSAASMGCPEVSVAGCWAAVLFKLLLDFPVKKGKWWTFLALVGAIYLEIIKHLSLFDGVFFIFTSQTPETGVNVRLKDYKFVFWL